MDLKYSEDDQVVLIGKIVAVLPGDEWSPYRVSFKGEGQVSGCAVNEDMIVRKYSYPGVKIPQEMSREIFEMIRNHILYSTGAKSMFNDPKISSWIYDGTTLDERSDREKLAMAAWLHGAVVYEEAPDDK